MTNQVSPTPCPDGWITLAVFHSHPHLGASPAGNDDTDKQNADKAGILELTLCSGMIIKGVGWQTKAISCRSELGGEKNTLKKIKCCDEKNK